MNQLKEKSQILRKPSWLKVRPPYSHECRSIKSTLAGLQLHTVCQEAACPNMSECFASGTATFLIMGNICTRDCLYCNVEHGIPTAIDENEINHLIDAVRKMKLEYVVITSVTRDDLPDGGAQVFADYVIRLRKEIPACKVEVLIPDFKGNKESIESVVRAKPDVISHNLETVPRLYSEVRPLASYSRSLELLKTVKDFNNNINTKSGIMLGLGETKEEVLELMKDLRKVNCDYFTIGQYLRPNKECLPVKEFIPPSEFEKYKIIGLEIMNFKSVNSAPFVRSSYRSYNG